MELLLELLALREAKGLTLSTDNPGGKWLEKEQEYCRSQGMSKEFGSPNRFGPVTATWSRQPLILVDVVAKIKGLRAEQRSVREQSLSFLLKHMEENDRLPPSLNATDAMSEPNQLQSKNYKQYAPFITVWYDGTPWISEGNHRIMAAKKLGWKYIPIELRYFTGGEEADGPLSPAKVKAMDSEAIAAGFKPENEFRAHPERRRLSSRKLRKVSTRST